VKAAFGDVSVGGERGVAHELLHFAQIGAMEKPRRIEDLKLADYLVLQPLDEDATLQEVLILAMQREKNAHEFYNFLAGIAVSEVIRDLFQFLAQQELGHKNKIETLYDDIIYKEF
jgi:hypothetical protein